MLLLNLLCKDHVTIKQVANFLTNYGARILNETKDDPAVMERLQLYTVPLTFSLYHRTISKDGIVHFLRTGTIQPHHIIG